MEQQEWGDFFKLYKQVALIAKDRQKTPDDLESAAMFFFELLPNYGIDAVKKAIFEYILSNKYMPTPSDIAKAIEGDPVQKAEWAWRLMIKALETYGHYDSVRFPEPAFHAIVMAYGSWERISAEFHNLDDKDLQIKSHEFKRMYISASKTASWDNVPAYLVGAYERNNREVKRFDCIPETIEVLTGKKIGVSQCMEFGQTEQRTIHSALSEYKMGVETWKA